MSVAAGRRLEVQPLSIERIEDLGGALRGTWGANCWCMFPILTDAQLKALPGEATPGERRKAAMLRHASGPVAPGLIAYADRQPVGWVAIGPRRSYGRVAASRATPAFDALDAWVIACLTVQPRHRGQGIAVRLIDAAVRYAFRNGAETVEAYPRVPPERIGDANVYYGTEELFRRAGFETVRGPLPNVPKHWVPRLVMRASRPDDGRGGGRPV